MRPNDKRWEERRSPNSQQVVRADDDRSAFERDRARIIHSSAFRRLQAKTQVLGISEGDFHRTRLTHSMEVAQIARGIGKRLAAKFPDEPFAEWLPPTELLEAISFAHDLGHPPFGHGGEVALDFSLISKADQPNPVGFEGNGQTLRILSRLESHTKNFGLDLTRRTVLGVLKYPLAYSQLANRCLQQCDRAVGEKSWVGWKPPKCYLDTEADVVEWALAAITKADRLQFLQVPASVDGKHAKTSSKTFDCSIMDLADEIAYGVHDLEDGVALGLISQWDWKQFVENKLKKSWTPIGDIQSPRDVRKRLFSTHTDSSCERKQVVGELVGSLLASLRVTTDEDYSCGLFKYRVLLMDSARSFLDSIQLMIREKVINSPEVQTIEYRGQVLVRELFTAFASDPMRLLGGNSQAFLRKCETNAKTHRVIADYIAGMTDEYATRFYERLFIPRRGNVFDKL